MDWYTVVKTIKGHRYLYRQKTWREGKRVRTINEYIGPDDGRTIRAPLTTPAPIAQPEIEPVAVKPVGPIDTDTSLHELLGSQSETWCHAWSAGRQGPVLVKKRRQVENVLRALKVERTHETAGAYYRPMADTMNIPPAVCFKDTEKQSATQAYYIVTFHELVHWSGNFRRLNRKLSSMGSLGYAREELVAELGAAMLMNHFGIDIGDTGRHARYFQVWLSRAGDKDNAIEHAKREAERAVRYILDRATVKP